MAFDYIKSVVEDINRQYKESEIVEKYDNYLVEETFVKMRDDKKLQTIIYKPDDNNRYPVILQRTCYPNNELIYKAHGENLSKGGFIFVYQYCRGTSKSEGIWEPNINERNDGIDTVDWILKQEWADEIGYWGTSYSALAGWAMADLVNGKVTSMCLTHYGTDRFLSAYEKGSFRQDILTSWTMDNAGFKIDADYIVSCKYMPHIEVDEALWGEKIEWYREYITNVYKNDEYWKNGFWSMLDDIPKKTKVPIYIMSGWYDHHHGSSMKTWENLSEEAKNNSWLEIGAWNHFFLPCIPGRKIDNIDNSEVIKAMRWFKLTLVDKVKPNKKIRTYAIGEDLWNESNEWEELKRNNEIYYFDIGKEEKHQLISSEKALLDEEVALNDSEISYVYNPKNPLITHGAEAMLKSFSKIGSLVQAESGYRDDVISFISKALDKEMRINGKIQVELYIKSDCEDTAFTAKIMEVTNEGKSYNIRSSITTILSDIRNEGKYEYIPGNIVKVNIDMWDIVYTIPKGSKLRVDISSSDFPQYNIHSNYPGIWSMQEKVRLANQTIMCGKKYPSILKIPIASK